MKKLIICTFLGLFFIANSSYAQCSHASKTAEAKNCVKPSEAALKAAANDPNIETKVCEGSGSICFKRKSVSADGTASFEDVRFDEASASFVAIPAGSAAGSDKKSCSASKACCAKGSASGKACCKAKSSAAAPNENAAPAKSE